MADGQAPVVCDDPTMKRAFVVAAMCLVAGCHSRAHVPINDSFPGRTAREILAHADSASLSRTEQPSGAKATRKLGSRDRNRIIEAMLKLEPAGGCRCLCGFNAQKWYVDYEVKGPRGSVTLEQIYGCPFAPTLAVVSAKTGKTKVVKVGGKSLEGPVKIFKRIFPKGGPFAAKSGKGAR